MDVKAFIGQVADPRREAKAQEVHQGKHMISETSSVSIVFFNM
jgi:hypothetical protein